ncbi:MAG: HAD hydrolase-like protein [Spirochaetes bacterium]|nr:HAD hydrolase-like protein [Spirochaetota bacterium]
MDRENLVQIIRNLSIPLNPVPVGELPDWALMRGRRNNTAGEGSAISFEGSYPEAVLFDVYGTLFISGSGDIGTGEDADDIEALGKIVLDAVYKFTGSDGLKPVYNEFLAGRVGMYVKKLLPETIRKTHRKQRNTGITYPEVDIRMIWIEVITALAALNIKGFPLKAGELKSLSVCGLETSVIEELAVRYECIVNPVWPMPGSGTLLKKLTDMGVITGIVSNAQFYTPLIFKALLGGSPEELGFKDKLLIFSYALSEAKPSTELFRRVTETLKADFGISGKNVLYVGNDILNDIKPAKESGLRTALFAGDERSLRLREDIPACRNIFPDMVIKDLREIERLFL